MGVTLDLNNVGPSLQRAMDNKPRIRERIHDIQTDPSLSGLNNPGEAHSDFTEVSIPNSYLMHTIFPEVGRDNEVEAISFSPRIGLIPSIGVFMKGVNVNTNLVGDEQTNDILTSMAFGGVGGEDGNTPIAYTMYVRDPAVENGYYVIEKLDGRGGETIYFVNDPE